MRWVCIESVYPLCGVLCIGAPKKRKKSYMFRSRQLILRKGGLSREDKEIIPAFSTGMEMMPLNMVFKQLPTHPTEQKKSDYLTWATQPSGELICCLSSCLPGPTLSARACLGHGLALGWTQTPMMDAERADPVTDEPQANNAACKVLCQVEYWFHVPCTLDTVFF